MTLGAIIFDAVGTVILPAEPVATTYRRLARIHGIDLPENVIRQRVASAFARQEKIDQANDWRTSEPRERERWQTIVAEALLELTDPDVCFDELWRHYADPAAWRPAPDLADLLERLPRGIRLGIASNFDSRLVEIVRQMPELGPFRSSVIVSSLVGWRKPSGRFFDDVIRQAGCERSSILFVGDDLVNDHEGATRAGLRSVWINPKAAQPSPDCVRALSELDLTRAV